MLPNPKDTAIAHIAAIAHEANRAYCRRFMFDDSQPAWEDAPEWQRRSVVDGVAAIIEGRVKSPRESHANWLNEKVRDGWSYGPVKDPVKKEHPCFVPYEELPIGQRLKDALFFAIVTIFNTKPA